MTVTNTTNRWEYTGDGVTANFAYTSKIFAETDLTVKRRTISTGALTSFALTTDYTVSGVGVAGGGNVTPVVTLSALYQLVIERNTPATQATDLQDDGPFPADTTETALDKLTVLSQQLEYKAARALRQPIGDNTAISELPNATDRASKLLGFDSSGNPTASAVSLPSSLVALDYVRVNTAGTAYELRTPAEVRTDLSLGSMALQAAGAVAITGGTVTGITDLAVADGGTGASNASDARTNLGLGTMATQNASAVAITGGTVDNATLTTASLVAATIDNSSAITIKDTQLTIQDDGDTSKQARFNAGSISAGTTRTYSLPDVGGDTLVTNTSTSTLTNKTLTTPAIDVINEASAAAGVTTDGVLHKDGGIDISGALALSGQIVFPASQNASSGANTLDDYEEGTFTPTLGVTSGTDGTHTYSVQVGFYLKIGSLVWFTARIDLSAKDAAMSGNAAIKGLPFTSLATSNSLQALSVTRFSNIVINAAGDYYFPTASIGSNAVIIPLFEAGNSVATTNLTEADFGNSSFITVSGCYRATA